MVTYALMSLVFLVIFLGVAAVLYRCAREDVAGKLNSVMQEPVVVVPTGDANGKPQLEKVQEVVIEGYGRLFVPKKKIEETRERFAYQRNGKQFKYQEPAVVEKYGKYKQQRREPYRHTVREGFSADFRPVPENPQFMLAYDKQPFIGPIGAGVVVAPIKEITNGEPVVEVVQPAAPLLPEQQQQPAITQQPQIVVPANGQMQPAVVVEEIPAVEAVVPVA